ncbi:DNA replication/repair protein RecF [Mycetocola reblochoni]|uniref:DNA replication and repair protein RecF n=2 Tax=Mycetocola reblochoni TaxID=331618 RepID=A0A1R4JF77_9MICO|nr:DNA replication/repair protein RecF [Mycetocola reblochoni]RLP67736.1 DNA replication/repair protein RecF [Mycetocola reblochoni]SJN30760.1 DNA recombination and repair protein RecF [Mycetocola reblochoni REB411]
MIVTHLSLRDFRNYAEAELELHGGTNLFIGRNGQGKTNLVESLVFLSTLSSHRVSGDQAMVRAGCEAAIVRTTFTHGDRELLAEVQINRSGTNRAQINRSAIRPRDLPWYVRTVLFAPEDLALVRGEPSGRRRFIDQLSMILAPRFSAVLADYERVLKQRNTLLKSLRGGLSAAQEQTLTIWDEKLISLGTEIIARRAVLVEQIRDPLRRAYAAVVDDDHEPTIDLSLSIDGYDVDADDTADRAANSAVPDSARIEAGFRAAMERRRRAERERGLTLVGPHRDDLLFGLNRLPVKGYASHGESWSFVLALKLATAELLRRDSDLGDPVLILDDVFAELDRQRRRRLAEAVTGFEQVLITAAVREDIPEELRAAPIFIRAGRVVDEDAVDV